MTRDRRTLGWVPLALLIVVYALPAWAVTVTPTGTILTVDYDEPSTNADGTPLTDLKETVVFYAFPGLPPVLCVTTPATTTTGGVHRSVACTVSVVEGQDVEITVMATARDLNGNAGAPSDPVVTRIDRLAPARIQ